MISVRIESYASEKPDFNSHPSMRDMFKDSREHIKLASRNPKITGLTIIGYGASE